MFLTDMPIKTAADEQPIDRIRALVDWKNDDMRMRMVRHDDLSWLLGEYDKLCALSLQIAAELGIPEDLPHSAMVHCHRCGHDWRWIECKHDGEVFCPNCPEHKDDHASLSVI